MGLKAFWMGNRSEIEQKKLHQLVALAGNGRLLDESLASQEFREFLTLVDPELLVKYATECLEDRFDESGLALQDVINEVGCRLGYEVKAGRYRGTKGEIGNDGLWSSPEGHRLVVEVKTTDAYRIELDQIARYRKDLLIRENLADATTSILIVVGREDTGGLECQVRGSQHAWVVRLISVPALLRLMRIKFRLENPRVHQQIRSALVPAEYTKVDGIIDLLFSAAKDAGEEEEDSVPPTIQTAPAAAKAKSAPVSFHDACAARIGAHLGVPLQKRSRAMFGSPEQGLLVTCSVSREHRLGKRTSYWFAFHPHQREALAKAELAYAGFGCGSEDLLFLFPFKEFEAWLTGMFTTTVEDRTYSHVEIVQHDSKYLLHRRQGFEKIDVTKFLLRPTSPDSRDAAKRKGAEPNRIEKA